MVKKEHCPKYLYKWDGKGGAEGAHRCMIGNATREKAKARASVAQDGPKDKKGDLREAV